MCKGMPYCLPLLKQQCIDTRLFIKLILTIIRIIPDTHPFGAYVIIPSFGS